MQFDLAPKYNEKARDKLAQVKAAKGMVINRETGASQADIEMVMKFLNR